MNKYTLGKEPEAVILWSLIENSPSVRRKISSKIVQFNTEIREISESNLSTNTKNRYLTLIWHHYRDTYVKHGYDPTNKIDTFFLCLLKIRYRVAKGYKKVQV